MRAYKQLTLILVECEKLRVISVSLFVSGQVILDVFVNGQSTTCNKFVEGERILCVVNLALEHWIQVLQVDVCILNK